MGVDEVLRLLGEQETMCRAKVERLEAEQERLAGLLATCRVELERLVVAREVIAGLVPASPVTAAASAGGGVPAVESTECGQQLLNILAEHAGPMRCWDIVAAMGEDPRVARRCYDAAPAIRNAADVLPATAIERAHRRPGPTATGRHLDASVEDGITVMTSRLFDHTQRRDPHHRRRWIALVDGNNHQLDRITAEAHVRGIQVTIIIDFIHVLQYLWDGLAHRHRRHRRRLPPPCQRPPRHHRRPLEPARRRSGPTAPRPDHQRRPRHLLEVSTSSKNTNAPTPAAT